MWKREGTPEPASTGRPEPVPGPERVKPMKATGERATIGSSITIRGEVTGEEDLLIQGRVEGSVNLKQHSVTVGREGEVKADIVGRVITVEGNVEGDLTADEQVVLRSSALVQGDITAPRVVLEDGARFRGGVDMGQTAQRGGSGASVAKPAASSAESRTASASTSSAMAGASDGGGSSSSSSKQVKATS